MIIDKTFKSISASQVSFLPRLKDGGPEPRAKHRQRYFCRRTQCQDPVWPQGASRLDSGNPLPLRKPVCPNRRRAAALCRRRNGPNVAVLTRQPHVVLHVSPYNWSVAHRVSVHRGRHAWSRPFYGSGRVRKGVRAQLNLLSEVCAAPRPQGHHSHSARDGSAVRFKNDYFRTGASRRGGDYQQFWMVDASFSLHVALRPGGELAPLSDPKRTPKPPAQINDAYWAHLGSIQHGRVRRHPRAVSATRCAAPSREPAIWTSCGGPFLRSAQSRSPKASEHTASASV